MLWTGDEGGRIFRVDPNDGSNAHVATIDGWALGLCLDGDGLLYVCAYDRGSIVRVDPRNRPLRDVRRRPRPPELAGVRA